VFDAKTEELRRESMLNELKQRIREVRQGPDGLAVSVDRRRRRRPSAD
jgi:glucose/arabinose dehydrogenase